MKPSFWLAGLHATMLACLPAAARADEPAGSVLVHTEAARQGSLPELVAAFGTAGPALDGGMTVALQQEGRVSAIAVTPGEAVRAGDRLLTFTPSVAARVGYQQAVSALALAQGQRSRTAQLLAQRLATRDQLAQADKALSDAQAALQGLQREGAAAPQLSVTAPFDGIVASVPVAQGDRVQPGTPLLTLTRADGLVVTVGIEPAERARVHAGQGATLQPLDGGMPLQGHVLRIDGMLNPKTRLIDADIAVPAGAVLSGAAFKAGILVGSWQGWVVPHQAVVSDGTANAVFQVHAGHAVRVAVQVLGTDGSTDVVQGRLAPADRVVTEGGPQLDDGAAVREQDTPASAPDAG